MKKPIEISDASILVKDNTILSILNPKIKVKKGVIHVTGFFDRNEFIDENDFEEKLDLKPGFYSRNIQDLPTIKAKGTFSEVFIHCVDRRNTSHSTMEFEFICHDKLSEITQLDKNQINSENFISIGIEGLNFMHENTTIIKRERIINKKPQILPLSYKQDYTETQLKFQFKNKLFNLNLFIVDDNDNGLVHFSIYSDANFNYDIYNEIKFPLRAFLSFAAGNNVVFREENYRNQNEEFKVIYSSKKQKLKKRLINYVPIDDMHFREYHPMRHYLECFNIYLKVDTQIKLSEAIFLLNEARKMPIDSGFFVMLIIIEKLSDDFWNSTFNTVKVDSIIDPEDFKKLFKSTREMFEKDFANIKRDNPGSFHDLFSKLCGINKKGRTDAKFDGLLNFAEISKTAEIENLLKVLRNLGIHQGIMDYPKGTAFTNYKALELLLNDIIANLMQYKGIRYIRAEDDTRYCDEKTNYKVSH